LCSTPSRPVNPNKKVDFEVDSDDGKICKTTADQSIVKDDFNKNLIVKAAKI
jgi:hypothetical protein